MNRSTAPIAMPDPFIVLFEEPKIWHARASRRASCLNVYCSFAREAEYGQRMPTVAHWCDRADRTLVIWEGL